jgi:hypothetical protein
MLVVGLAMPFFSPCDDDAQVAVGADGLLTPVRSPRKIQFARGAFAHALTGYVELVMNHVWVEHLASTKHGLQLFETAAGLYFHARFPETPFARNVYASIESGKIRHTCALSRHTECDDGPILTVRRADLVAVNLLLVASAHQPLTWILPAGAEAEKRIAAEGAAAHGRALWALNRGISRSQLAAELRCALERNPSDVETRKVLEQLARHPDGGAL